MYITKRTNLLNASIAMLIHANLAQRNVKVVEAIIAKFVSMLGKKKFLKKANFEK